MTAYLCETARTQPLEFNEKEQEQFIKVVAKRNERNLECCRELFVGVFFDGTNNNAERDRPLMRHGNVARLFDVFPTKPPRLSEEQRSNHIRLYVPGVGTEFKDVGDTGVGSDKKLGLGFAAKGEARIVWGLLAVLNGLGRYFSGSDLRNFEQTKKLANELSEFNIPLWGRIIPQLAPLYLANKRQVINHHRNEVLTGLCRELDARVKARNETSPKPKILGIRLSVFGFSRGAAEARAFSRWFVDMCENASGSMSLAGLSVDFDFLGIFDTVASVGLANSGIVADGHMEWADAEHSLRIPDEVTRCVHLVSAHEVRRSFPLDSIRNKTQMDKRYLEAVYPGVHSDVGGGYAPMEQGRGTDPKGHDMLSRIPLAHMYREARLANVPLDVDGTGVLKAAKEALTVSPTTTKAFNDYLACCKVTKDSLEKILDEQTRLHIRWRKARLTTMGQLPSVKRASLQERTDLLEATRELDEEAKRLSLPVSKADLTVADPTPVILVKLGVRVSESMTHTGLESDHYQEWKVLKNSWESNEHLPLQVLSLFDDYSHDSRAWFKPFGDDDDVWEADQRKRMQQLDARQRQSVKQMEARQKFLEDDKKRRAERQRNGQIGGQQPQNPNAIPGYSSTGGASVTPLSPWEKQDLDRYQKTGEVPPQTTGREPFALGGGYLRYRRIYYGTDAKIIVSMNPNQEETRA